MIYLDNASTTKQDEQSIMVQNNYAKESFFNPSAIYANENVVNLEKAKQIIKKKLGSDENSTIIFTGSATEANNMVLNSFKDEIIISATEHASIYNYCQNLILQGKKVTICPSFANGQVDIEKLKQLITPKTKLVSIIHVGNETGVINDIEKIAKIVKQINPNTSFHSDGVQAFLKVNFSLNNTLVDFYTISAHKIGGPKGIGVLWAKSKNKLKPLLIGGEQEYNLRAGTENLPLIMAFANVCENRKNDNTHVLNLKNCMIDILSKEKNIKVNFQGGSPYILSLSFFGINGETLLNELAMKNIFVSRASACSSKKVGNRIFESLAFSQNQIKGLIRVSFFETNTIKEVTIASNEILKTYQDLLNRTKKG